MAQVCESVNLDIIGLDGGLSSVRRLTIAWTSGVVMLIGSLRTKDKLQWKVEYKQVFFEEIAFEYVVY